MAIVLFTFTLGLLLGLSAPINISQLQEIASYALALPPVGFMLYILANNLFVTLIAVIGGLIAVTPLFIAFVNGVVIGSVVTIATSYYSLPEVLWLILPHGVFEIPALLLACSLGLDVAHDVVNHGFMYAWARLGEKLQTYILIIILLIIAAIIETCIAYYRA
ncbi:protein of unknown function DUF95 transmembrane [Pyrolobus fumarii 1A]|uniref:Stage II sporulation protein M n=1 Tax=Pyrolobus fumarii (strain DSM 11204 / 1A) TaxID=694429 RepID=G0EHL6_PYRF1|nr:protein of unknown function DUF95 transmembrane [Pyrolobus fumarii 1A]